MIRQVMDTITKYNLISPGDGIVVGVSGGADSLALLHILGNIRKEYDISVYAVHINHGIRGSAALRDAEFVAEISREWSIPFFIHRTNISRLAGEWNMSEEEAGRKVRYDFFDHTLQRVGANKIATAHHKNDQAETILHHILRGTGLRGLCGMSPLRDGKYIKPFLEVDRYSIEEYCESNDIKYMKDETNDFNIYTRNRIRNELIPYLSEYFNPNIVDTIVRMGEVIRDEEGFIEDYTKEHFDGMVSMDKGNIRINTKKFLSYGEAIKRRIIRHAIETLDKALLKDIQLNHINNVIKFSVESRTGSWIGLPGSLTIYKDYEYMVFTMDSINNDKIEDFDINLPVPGSVRLENYGVEIIAEEVELQNRVLFDSNCVYINKSRIKEGLRVRNRRQGDRFKPFGMNGTKKLKDYFIDKKIPKYKRDRIPLVVDRDNIIWVAGCQINEDYKISHNSKATIRLKMEVIDFGKH